ncbi:unnamed protein product, partial [Amoebophrya sp. A120]|eukprot:GSA120T00009375001.1
MIEHDLKVAHETIYCNNNLQNVAKLLLAKHNKEVNRKNAKMMNNAGAGADAVKMIANTSSSSFADQMELSSGSSASATTNSQLPKSTTVVSDGRFGVDQKRLLFTILLQHEMPPTQSGENFKLFHMMSKDEVADYRSKDYYLPNEYCP